VKKTNEQHKKNSLQAGKKIKKKYNKKNYSREGMGKTFSAFLADKWAAKS